MTRTRSKFENELNENKVQFVRIRDKNVNFVLCQFQNRNSKHSFCKYRSGTVNSNTVNSKFYLIRSYFYNFPNIPCLKIHC